MRICSGTAFALSALTITGLNLQQAHASGPVERLVGVLLNPSDPNLVVVRWGIASEGFLFSSDGGHTFKAMCSNAIEPSSTDPLLRVSGARVPGAAATLLDTHGKLLVSQIDGLYTDDTGGCGWNKQLDQQWPISIKRDPKAPDELVAVVNTHTASDAQSHLMRRSADGVTWTQAGALVPELAGQHAYGGDLIVSSTATGTQMYAAISVTKGDVMASGVVAQNLIVASSDGGQTWTPGFVQPAAQEVLTLLAIDPNEPKRILATIYRDTTEDSLMLSEDEGQTFTEYLRIRETAGAVFGADGRVYIADAGDSSSSTTIGGLFTAAKLGDPLTLVANTSMLDCITYDANSDKLWVCIRDKVGQLDPVSGAFTKLGQIGTVPDLISCPGVDIVDVCKGELNFGASWCCAGHYPCTPFCADYDITMSASGALLYCGLSGRAFDLSTGRAPSDTACDVPGLDAGVPQSLPDGGNAKDGATVSDARAPDAGTAPTSSSKSGGGGCSVGVHPTSRSFGGPLASLGIVLIALGRALRRRAARTGC